MQVGTRIKTRTVSRTRYEKMLAEELERINHRLLKQLTFIEMAISRKRPATRGRFRIFRELRDMGYSFPSIANVAMMDHTSIMSGINTINREEPISDRETVIERAAIKTALGVNLKPAELTLSAANGFEALAEA